MFNNSMITIEETKNKYVFWDIDGTLAAYRFNNHVGDPNGTNNGMSIQEIEEGVFLHRLPSKLMQKVVATCQAKQNIIMSHCQIKKEMDDKQLWLNKHYPTITERLLTYDNIPKYKSIISYCCKNNIALSDCVFVDDVLPYLREAEAHGIKSYHISSFLDWELVNNLIIDNNN